MRDQFLFDLKLADEPGFEALLDDVARCVLQQVGYAASEIADTVAKLRVAVQDNASQGRRECKVEFRAEAGQLFIVCSFAGGREWRMERALPD